MRFGRLCGYGLCLILTMLFCNPGWAANWVSVKDYNLDYPLMIAGTYQKKMSNVTEPRPVESKYLQVIAGGVVLIDNGAGLFLRVRWIGEPIKNTYFKIEYPNPKDPSQPLVNDFFNETGLTEYNFSSPDVIGGLVGYRDYFITVYVYENKESKEPMDVLKQKVRSYVDTRGEVLIFKKVLKTVPTRRR